MFLRLRLCIRTETGRRNPARRRRPERLGSQASGLVGFRCFVLFQILDDDQVGHCPVGGSRLATIWQRMPLDNHNLFLGDDFKMWNSAQIQQPLVLPELVQRELASSSALLATHGHPRTSSSGQDLNESWLQTPSLSA